MAKCHIKKLPFECFKKVMQLQLAISSWRCGLFIHRRRENQLISKINVRQMQISYWKQYLLTCFLSSILPYWKLDFFFTATEFLHNEIEEVRNWTIQNWVLLICFIFRLTLQSYGITCPVAASSTWSQDASRCRERGGKIITEIKPIEPPGGPKCVTCAQNSFDFFLY